MRSEKTLCLKIFWKYSRKEAERYPRKDRWWICWLQTGQRKGAHVTTSCRHALWGAGEREVEGALPSLIARVKSGGGGMRRGNVGCCCCRMSGMQLCIHQDYDTTCEFRSPLSVFSSKWICTQVAIVVVVVAGTAAAGCFDSTHFAELTSPAASALASASARDLAAARN